MIQKKLNKHFMLKKLTYHLSLYINSKAFPAKRNKITLSHLDIKHIEKNIGLTVNNLQMVTVYCL